MVSCLTFGLMGKLSFCSIVAHTNLYLHISSVSPAGCVHSSHWPPSPFLSRALLGCAASYSSCVVCNMCELNARAAMRWPDKSLQLQGAPHMRRIRVCKPELSTDASALFIFSGCSFPTSFSYLCVFQLLPINNLVLDNLILCKWWYYVSHVITGDIFPCLSSTGPFYSLKCRLKAASLRTCVLRSHAHSGALGLL